MAVTYGQYVQTFLKVDMTDSGQLYVEVPGYASDTFRVTVSEEGLVPVSTHCRCHSFKHKGVCIHTQIVDAFYARIYKSNVVKHQEKQLEALIDISDAIEQAYEEVALIEQIATTIEDQTPSIVKNAPKIATSPKLAPKIAKKGNKLVKAVAKITDISKKGNLNTSRAFSLMR